MPLKSGYSSEVIGKNIAMEVKRGTPHKQAIAIALDMARREWRKYHPVGAFPHHLKGAGKYYSENPISEKTAHKLRKAAPGTFAKMTDEEIKRAVKVKKKRVRKNPVRPLKKRSTKIDGYYYIGILSKGIRYFYTLTNTFDSDIRKAEKFVSDTEAFKKAAELQEKYRKWINVWFKAIRT